MKKYFRFMGAYYSCNEATFKTLSELSDKNQPINLADFPDVRELSQRPRSQRWSHIPWLSQPRARIWGG